MIRTTRKLLGDGLLVALLSGGGYGAAYLYKREYLSELGIPSVFVQVDASSIVRALLTVALVIWMSFLALLYISAFMSRVKLPRIRAYEYAFSILFMAFALVAILAIIFSHVDHASYYIFLGTIAFLGIVAGLLTVIVPALKGGRGSWRRNVIRAYKVVGNSNEIGQNGQRCANGVQQFAIGISSCYERMGMAVSVVAISYVILINAGMRNAKGSHEWAIVELGMLEYVVVEKLSDGYLLKPFDSKREVASGSFVVWDQIPSSANLVSWRGRLTADVENPDSRSKRSQNLEW